MTGKLLKQGAEARLFIGEYDGKACIIKERFSKKYRHPDLDIQITKERMRAETKAATRCAAAGIKTPAIFNTDFTSRKIYMEYFVNSITVKEYIKVNMEQLSREESQRDLEVICAEIGRLIGIMHSNSIIHGDLTTSNILMDPKNGGFKEYDVIFIDFGLSHYSQSLEDKGVDLYVLERALLSTHSDIPWLFEVILKSYEEVYKESCKEVIAKFEEVRARGRKRTMVG